MLLVSAIHAIQRKQQSNTYVCLTQAWPGRESDAVNSNKTGTLRGAEMLKPRWRKLKLVL